MTGVKYTIQYTPIFEITSYYTTEKNYLRGVWKRSGFQEPHFKNIPFINSAKVPKVLAYTEKHIDIGIGMKPELTGKGLGFTFFSLILRYIR